MTMLINKTKVHEVIDMIDDFHKGSFNEPMGFDMSTWFVARGVNSDVPEPKRYAIECRTSACLAGWTVIALDPDGAEAANEMVQWSSSDSCATGERFMTAASALLEADRACDEELRDLFLSISYGWDEAREHLLHIVDQCQDVAE
jgi:hypothetical protein